MITHRVYSNILILACIQWVIDRLTWDSTHGITGHGRGIGYSYKNLDVSCVDLTFGPTESQTTLAVTVWDTFSPDAAGMNFYFSFIYM